MIKSPRKYSPMHLKSSILTLMITWFPANFLKASDTIKNEEFNPSEMINHHIGDAHLWEIYHGFTIYLPVIVYSKEKGIDIFSSANFYDEHHKSKVHNGYIMNHGRIMLESGRRVFDFSITKNVLFVFLDAVILVLIFMAVARGYEKNRGHAPKGVQSFFEPIILFVKDDIVKPNIGPKYERFLPYMLTLFFFIWFGNLLGLLPAAANMTGNISVTLVLAALTLVITLFSGKKTYWMHLLNPLGGAMIWPAKILLYLILVPIEIIGIFTKPFSLMVRLFANITAGHIIILSILSLGFMLESVWVGIVGALFATMMTLLELFVAILQAYVFTLLSAMYFGAAMEERH